MLLAMLALLTPAMVLAKESGSLVHELAHLSQKKKSTRLKETDHVTSLRPGPTSSTPLLPTNTNQKEMVLPVQPNLVTLTEKDGDFLQAGQGLQNSLYLKTW